MRTRLVSAALAAVGAAALFAACNAKEQEDDDQQAGQAPVSPLTNPNAPEVNETAPATYRARFETSKGTFEIEVTRAWAPKGADRFYNLVKRGWFDESRFFRVVPKFMVQFGINGDPNLSKWWRNARIADDPATQSNKRGMITFAMAGPDSRTTQVFINFVDNTFLDSQGFSPFGRVVTGMDVVDGLNSEYGEGPSKGQGQFMIQTQGNAFLQANFPNLDYIKKASIVP